MSTGLSSEAMLFADGLDGDTGGKVEECTALPVKPAFGGFEQPRLIGRGHGPRGDRRVDPEPVGEILEL